MKNRYHVILWGSVRDFEICLDDTLNQRWNSSKLSLSLELSRKLPRRVAESEADHRVFAFLDKRPFALLLVGVAHCSPARCAHLMTELFGTALSNANARELRSLHPPHSSSVSLGTREDARGLATTVPRVPFAVLRTTNLRRKMQQHDLRVVARRHQKRQSGFFGRRP